ncbi:hypothetical protein BgiMline_019633, partial [Biomphalaria glabrata]
MFHPLLLSCLASLLAVSDCWDSLQSDVECSNISSCFNTDLFREYEFLRLWSLTNQSYYDQYC